MNLRMNVFQRTARGRKNHRRARRFLAVLIAALLAPVAARADYTITPQPQITWGVWEGWGTSLCWWANVFGPRADLADLLFTTNAVTLNDQTLPGLGLNIVRYNAGACTSNAVNGATLQASPHIPAYKQIAGYWRDGVSSDPTSASWDWTADANQRAMLLQAKARGADRFELFSNSPLWWQCRNHNPSGATPATDDNLPPENYRQHAIYLATVARYARDHWGITFNSVEPFNEPSADWWPSTGGQEGCHFGTTAQAAVLRDLRAELDQRGLPTMHIAASDESLYDQALATWKAFNARTKALVDRVNVHGYQYEKGRRDAVYAAVAGKPLWNSEYGDPDVAGAKLAANLNLDFHWLHPTAWCYWQPLDAAPNWSLLTADFTTGALGTANPKYYVLAQYTRHIRPGMTIIASGDSHSVAAYDAAGHKLVLVTCNAGAAQTLTCKLTQCSVAAGPVHCWTTATGPGPKYEPGPDLIVTRRTFSAAVPAGSVTTFEIENVDLTAKLPATPP
ncbi:MAG TPA: glycoside hydrolase [Dongiaceae bacterium]|nr:glycoside hydrolase [Dongiaceae bacterium]